jgi:hypothetical protein
MKMKKCMIGFALVSSCIEATAQDPQNLSNPTKLDYNISTPNMASIDRYGNIPVSLFTGVPNVNIPLYNISVGNHQFPISISYHASGIKVDDISSDVGLGFNLNATYSISRTIRGKQDEMGYSGNNDAAKIVKTNSAQSSVSTIDTFRASANNIWDTEPDEFNFNIGDASGKFIIAPDKIIVMPDQDIKVEYTPGYFFILTDAKGIKYHFNDASGSSSIGCGDSPETLEYNSSWYISKILYPDTNDSLVFNYTTEYLELTSSSETKNYDYPPGYAPYPVRENLCLSTNSVLEKKLSGIIFPQGKINFFYNIPKLEISNTYLTSQALIYFEVKDVQNNVVEKVNFFYSYYNSASGNNLAKKLKLDSLYVIYPNGDILNKHKFEYNGTDIAAYQSKSKDHWGYNNGASNLSLIPGNTFTLYDGTGMPFTVPGGDREVNPNQSILGILNKITYPTGGYTFFEFENNTYGYGCGGGVIQDTVFNYGAFGGQEHCRYNETPQTKSSVGVFTADRNFASQIVVTGPAYSCTGNTRNYILKDVTTNAILAQGQASIPYINFIAGHQYQLTIEVDCQFAEANMLTCLTSMQVSIPKVFKSISAIRKNLLGGGLRIKKITDYDQYRAVSNVRTYSYQMPDEQDRSSGILMFKPRYDYSYEYDKDFAPDLPGNWNTYHVPDFRTVISNCFTSEAGNTAQNNQYSVAYQYVKEIIGAAGEGGSNLSHFSTLYRNCGTNYPFAPLTSRYYTNGQLLSMQTYNSSGTLVKRATNYYSYILNDKIMGWKVAYKRFRAGENLTSTSEQYWGLIYHYLSEKIRLDSTLTEQILSTVPVSQKQNFDYLTQESYYPYRAIFKNSDGNIHSQYTWRTTDFNVIPASGLTGATQALRYMKDNHLNDYSIESYSQINGLTTASLITEYLVNDLGTSKKILPARVFKLNTQGPVSNYSALNHSISSNSFSLPKDSRMTAELQYSGYNEKGNPNMLTGLEGKKIIVLHGYYKRLPVARLDNVDEATLTNFMNANPSIQATFDNPASDQALRNAVQQLRANFPNAFVTSYTYKPLVGITSMTNINNATTYFEYDAMNRLVLEKDADGNILKKHTYQYQATE